MSSAVIVLTARPVGAELPRRFVMRSALASRDGRWLRVAIMEVVPGYHPRRIDARLRGVVRIVFDRKVAERDYNRCAELAEKLVGQLNDPLAYEVLKCSPGRWPKGFQL